MPRQVSPEIGQNRQVAEHKLVFMMGEELKKEKDKLNIDNEKI